MVGQAVFKGNHKNTDRDLATKILVGVLTLYGPNVHFGGLVLIKCSLFWGQNWGRKWGKYWGHFKRRKFPQSKQIINQIA